MSHPAHTVVALLSFYCRYIENNVGNITVPGLDTYPDFVAMGLLLVATVLVSIGVNVSTLSLILKRVISIVSSKANIPEVCLFCLCSTGSTTVG